MATKVRWRRNTRSGFTDGQRAWIRRRDGNECVLCGSTESLQVHHVVPFRWGVTVWGWSFERVNSCFNGVTLCEKCHNGKGNKEGNYHAVHPDIARAFRQYGQDKSVFDRVFADREELCRRGKEYWNTVQDNLLAEIAICNTLEYALEHPEDDPRKLWTFD